MTALRDWSRAVRLARRAAPEHRQAVFSEWYAPRVAPATEEAMMRDLVAAAAAAWLCLTMARSFDKRGGTR